MRKAAVFLLASGALVLGTHAGCQSTQPSHEPASPHYTEALRHLEQRDLPAALRACQEALRERPRALEPYRLMGFLLNSSGQFDQAIAVYQRALALDSTCAVLHNDVACIYADHGKTNKAMAHLLKAAQLAPGLAFLHYNTGALLENLGRYEESEVAYRKALELDPEDAKVHTALGHSALRQGRLSDAEAHYRRALALNPRDKLAYRGLADLAMAGHRYAEAVENYQRAFSLDPHFHDACYGLVQAYLRSGQSAKSREALRTFVALGPRLQSKVLLVLSDPRRKYALAKTSRDAEPRRGDSSAPTDAIPVHYTDATSQAGIAFTHTSGATGSYYMVETMGAGACFSDGDGDGDPDLYLVNGHALPRPGPHPPSDALYQNNGDGTFAEQTRRARLRDRGYGMGCAAADYDGDGDQDLYVTNFGPNALYRNDGDGTFAEVTEEAGGDDPLWGASAGFFDYDNDGDLDLYVANYLDFALEGNLVCGQGSIRDYCDPSKYRGAPDVLYRNDEGRFADATKATGVSDPGGKGLGVATGDYDRDGYPDLYVANDGTPNFLYHNEGGGRFAEVGLASGTAYDANGLAEAGMGVAFGDVDNDGYPDILVTSFAREGMALYHNRRDGTFAEISAVAGLEERSLLYVGFGAHFFDCDNDADQDIFVTNGHVYAHIDEWDDTITYAQPSQLFLNADGAYRDVSATAGQCFAVRRVGRGSAVADYDEDGDLDVVVATNNGPAALLRNDGGNSGNWLQVRLVGRRNNRQGLGARIEVTSETGTQAQEVNAAAGYLSSNDLPVHFGLGSATTVSLRVRWPDGQEQRFSSVPANRRITIVEGEEIPQMATSRR